MGILGLIVLFASVGLVLGVFLFLASAEVMRLVGFLLFESKGTSALLFEVSGVLVFSFLKKVGGTMLVGLFFFRQELIMKPISLSIALQVSVGFYLFYIVDHKC